MKFRIAEFSLTKPATAFPAETFSEMFGTENSTVIDREVTVEWTDETSSSRYGIGTITDGDQDYGPADTFPWDTLNRTVAQWLVDSYGHGTSRRPEGFYTPEEIEILARYCSQCPDGPQFTPSKW